MKQNTVTTKRLAVTAMLAALTVAGSALRIKVPLGITGFSAFHLGNIMCSLSGILLGPWLGGLAAGLGSAIYDMFDPVYISECWLTFLTKGIYGVAVGLIAQSGEHKWNGSYLKAIWGAVTGAVTYALLYLGKSYLYNGRLLNGLTHEAALINLAGKLPATFFNALIAIISAPLLAVAISRALQKSHLSLE